MSKKKIKKVINENPISEQDLANARLGLALAILDSENGQQIVASLHKLTMMYVKQAEHHHKNKKNKKAKMLKHTADEFFTITMCAVYQKQDQRD